MDKKTLALNTFVQKFGILRENEKDVFSRIVNKLFQVNYLTIQKLADANDYRFILFYKELFDSFFQLVDFQLEIKKHDEVIFIRNFHHFNKLKLKKEESLVLLIFRILFQKKKESFSHNKKVEVYLQDIYTELKNIGYSEIRKLNKETFKRVLILLRQYNIIDYSDNSNYLSDHLIIIIYPSILYLVNLEMIEYYQELLSSKQAI
ncbi:DUF4194 domain-containing protein [Candidatus Phytoplasma melaleucae]|uniref:DUF4194 domain-containing protein n=1 Tax=Candidatus Phytoplasma melaleucae TaxID=2982630 RepID=A0ABT9DD98_9MOLU|nr:DUF4194 domain-containing protein ['Melaleuca sp.' phytoplasma]MDO8168043.1 DUF4194 domain-containing protein ['Melaleuca sp.' phytoplasma]MDV3205324.1 DUF4194 domain-containing protein [Weeping tea tree witches'-broom phytoplasma]